MRFVAYRLGARDAESSPASLSFSTSKFFEWAAGLEGSKGLIAEEVKEPSRLREAIPFMFTTSSGDLRAVVALVRDGDRDKFQIWNARTPPQLLDEARLLKVISDTIFRFPQDGRHAPIVTVAGGAARLENAFCLVGLTPPGKEIRRELRLVNL